MQLESQLSRFEPLERILFYDDFDHGLQGWTPLIGNYEDSLDSILPDYRDLRGPMLSNLTQWDTGTDGSLNGNYALKLATRSRAGSMAVAIKRATFRHAGPIRSAYLPSSEKLRETDVCLLVLFDLQDSDLKVMPHHITRAGWLRLWQTKSKVEPLPSAGQDKSHCAQRLIHCQKTLLQRDRHQAKLALSVPRLRPASMSFYAFSATTTLATGTHASHGKTFGVLTALGGNRSTNGRLSRRYHFRK